MSKQVTEEIYTDNNGGDGHCTGHGHGCLATCWLMLVCKL